MYLCIRNLREDNDLIQSDVADILSYTRSSYDKIEREENFIC
ncbi:XRE family transcriptional regulator, partial [Enterococcus faecalis]|nr:XRE family transcriptional regulator [Enterococcus faecalis]